MHSSRKPLELVRSVALGSVLSIGSLGVLPARAALPAIDALQPLALHYGVNHVPGFAPDGRAATVFMAHRENGNAHSYDVLVVSIDPVERGPGARGPTELVEVDRQGGESPDMIVVEPFDGENAISAVRFARGRMGGTSAMLLLQARRQVGQVDALTDPAPVALSVWRLDGPSDEIGRTPYVFRLVGVATTTQPYRDAGEALDHEWRWAASSPYTQLPSAERLAADLSTFGEREVLQERLLPARHVVDDLLRHIESGEPRWLRIAVALRHVSDAGASEGLAAALSVALAKRPENVLRVLASAAPPSPFTVAEVCSARFAFIEEPAAEKRWRHEAYQAVAAARDQQLASTRADCLSALRP